MTAPITPDNVIARRRETYPAAAIEAINDLVAEHWDGSEARVPLTAVAAALGQRGFGTNEEQKRDHLWDFEPIFEDAGWRCTFEKPGYNETGFRGFVFVPRSKV